MDNNPFQPPREKGIRRPTWTFRTKIRNALFISFGTLTGLALAAMLLFDLGWQINALIWTCIALGFAMGWLIPPPEARGDS